MITLTIKRGRAKPLWYGHPWVYSQAVEGERDDYEPGDVVEVRDSEGRYIGRGFANPRSKIRVRIVTRRDETVDAALLRARVAEAVALRAKLGLPSAETSCYRLINSEGDGLPGVVVDVYGDAVCVQFTALGMKRLAQELFDALEAELHPKTIYQASAGGFAALEGFSAEPCVVRGESRSSVPCVENGVKLEIEPLSGQKTGAFLDQRENRARIGSLARGAKVLDCYCYVGGFALAAARGGAASVTGVDVSARALEKARAHAELNGVGPFELVEADVFRYLEGARARSYDLVLVDPPKFARAQKDLEAALKGYRRLNALALATCKEGALYATSSCSQLVDMAEFERMLAGAAQDAGRRVTVLHGASQGPDHPVPPGFPEGRYLKFVLCRVS